MLNKVYVDGNWIANDYFFKWCEKITPKPFMEVFNELSAQAERVIPAGSTQVNNMDCILLGDRQGYYLVQNQYLLEIGFDFIKDDADSFQFMLNKERSLLFVYDEDDSLLGGVMLVVIPGLPEPEELELKEE